MNTYSAMLDTVGGDFPACCCSNAQSWRVLNTRRAFPFSCDSFFFSFRLDKLKLKKSDGVTRINLVKVVSKVNYLQRVEWHLEWVFLITEELSCMYFPRFSFTRNRWVIIMMMIIFLRLEIFQLWFVVVKRGSPPQPLCENSFDYRHFKTPCT